MVRILRGDCVRVLASMSPELVDAVVCDPPYGLAFMGQDWDRDLPMSWVEEAYRVLRPGGVLKACSATRTSHRLCQALAKAGFRLTVQAWVHGMGVPKSGDVGKSVARVSPEDAELWTGWGTCLKPSWEPVVVATKGPGSMQPGIRQVRLLRKPLSEATLVANVLDHQTGALNIRVGRVPYSPEDLALTLAKNPGRQDVATTDVYGGGRPQQVVHVQGRHPADLVFVHRQCQDACQAGELARQSQNPGFPRRFHQFASWEELADYSRAMTLHHDGQVRAWEWLGPESGPEEIARAYGDLKPGGHAWFVDESPGCELTCLAEDTGFEVRDSLAVLDCRSTDTRAVHYAPKASRAERAGSGHPTVKPLKLMHRLLDGLQGRVLDPFAGSGSTLVAAIGRPGLQCLGIEVQAEYVEAARARLQARARHPELPGLCPGHDADPGE